MMFIVSLIFHPIFFSMIWFPFWPEFWPESQPLHFVTDMFHFVSLQVISTLLMVCTRMLIYLKVKFMAILAILFKLYDIMSVWCHHVTGVIGHFTTNDALLSRQATLWYLTKKNLEIFSPNEMKLIKVSCHLIFFIIA